MKNLYPLKIDAQAHVLPPKYRKALSKFLPANSFHAHFINQPEFDMENWFRTMDKFEGLVQVLTLTGLPVESIVDPQKSVELARMANDEMAELVARYPERFVTGIASLPMNDMDTTLKELDRAIKDLKLRGIQLHTPIRDKPLDSPEFMPLYEKMSQYNLPIFLHPLRYKDYADYRTEKESKYLVYLIAGWTYETTAAMLRLVFSGMLEKYPNLRIVAHHNGAFVSFLEGRILEIQYDKRMPKPVYAELKKPPIQYLKENFYADTEFRSNPALMCTYHFFGADHVLFGTGMPYGYSPWRSVQWGISGIEQMDISDCEKQMIFEGNARRLLRLPI